MPFFFLCYGIVNSEKEGEMAPATRFFVIYGQDTFCAIEVKNTARIQSKMLTGLTSFREDYPEAQALLLYRGQERLRINDVLWLPCDDFLRNLHPQRQIHPSP